MAGRKDKKLVLFETRIYNQREYAFIIVILM